MTDEKMMTPEEGMLVKAYALLLQIFAMVKWVRWAKIVNIVLVLILGVAVVSLTVQVQTRNKRLDALEQAAQDTKAAAQEARNAAVSVNGIALTFQASAQANAGQNAAIRVGLEEIHAICVKLGCTPQP
jgi:type II secretory pathway pseudopilin PulG